MKKYSVTVNYNEKELCQQFENKSDAVEEAKYLLHVVGISLLPEEASLLSTAFRELFFEKSSNSVHVDISAGINLPDARVTFRKTANEQSSKDPSHPIVYLKHELIDLLQDTRYSIDEHLHDLTIRMQQPEGIISVEFNFTLGGYIWGISFPNGKAVAGDYSIDITNRDENYLISEVKEAATRITKQFRAVSRKQEV